MKKENVNVIMHSFNQAVSIENFPNIIGTDWFNKQVNIWLSEVKDNDLTIQPVEKYGKQGIKLALKAGDWKLATNIALTVDGEVDVDNALEIAYLLDSPILVFSIYCFYNHCYGDLSEWLENDGDISINALSFNADKCFLLGLLDPNFDVRNQNTSYHYDEDSMCFTDTLIMRPLDKLLLPEYKEILDKLALDTNFKVVTSGCCSGESCKVDLFAALVMECKFEQARHLVERSLVNINPILEHQDCTLFDYALMNYEQDEPDILKFLLQVSTPILKNMGQILSCYPESFQQILELLPNLDDFIVKIDEVVYERITKQPIYSQIEENPFTRKLQYNPFPKEKYANRNKEIPIRDDIIRLYPELLTHDVTELTISLIETELLVIELYKFNHNKPEKRALINSNCYKALSRISHHQNNEGTKPTDFQIQLAFLSLSPEEIQDVLSQLEPIDTDSMRY